MIPNKSDIFGTQFSNTNLTEVVAIIQNREIPEPNYVCFPSTNTISKAYSNRKFRHVLNNAVLTLADGKVTEYYAKLNGNSKLKNVSGFWLMRALLQTRLSHYFYGCDNKTLSKLKSKIEQEFPDANILGYKAPPFVNTDEIFPNTAIMHDFREINNLKPDLIWIGISTVKQDLMMHYYINYLDQGLMLGVGGVFLYMSGDIKKGPEWIKRLGLRWILRLLQEPRRLWRSTLPSGGFFIYLVFKELISKKR